MLRVAISGVAGRMGNVLVHALAEAEDLSLGAAFENSNDRSVGYDAGEVAGVGKVGVIVSDSPLKKIEDFDVVIDFSVPEATIGLGKICQVHSKAMVIGTTGFNDSQLEALRGYSRNIPIFVSPNMSLGVNILFKLVSEAAAAFGDDVDYEIMEAHHSRKIDAPSGTAARLGEILANNLSRDVKSCGVYGRQGNVGRDLRKKLVFLPSVVEILLGTTQYFLLGKASGSKSRIEPKVDRILPKAH